MAYVTQGEVAPTQQDPNKVQAAPIAAGGAGIGGSTKAANTPGQNVPAQPSAQLSAYLGANQPQAAALSQNIAGTLTNQANAAGQAILPAVNTVVFTPSRLIPELIKPLHNHRLLLLLSNRQLTRLSLVPLVMFPTQQTLLRLRSHIKI
jgi:hypothetical protein